MTLEEEKTMIRQWLQGEVLRRIAGECLEEGCEIDIVTGNLVGILNGQD